MNLRFLALVLLVLGACGRNPRYCDEQTACGDPSQVCDLAGVCPESEGLTNSCIDPSAICWDGGPTGYRVGGTVAGLWSGGQLDLRLEAGGVNEVLPLSEAGGFSFDARLTVGTNYLVTVADQPEGHDCEIDNGTGTVAELDVVTVAVSCSAPSVDVALLGPLTLTPGFDPNATSYAVDASVITQYVQFVVTAAGVDSIIVAGAAAVSGAPTARLPLALGANEIAIELAVGPATQTYTMTVDRGSALIGQAGYLKASNTEANDRFGASVAGDGDTLVVGAFSEASSAVGVDGNQANNSAYQSGAAYVFRRVGNAWAQEAYLKASNTGGPTGGEGVGDCFGMTVAISGDVIVVGAPYEDSSATTINGNGANNSALDAGAAYVFRRNGTTWAQEAYLKASNANAGDYFGLTIAISGDTIAVGSDGEQSNATGVNPSQVNNSLTYAGAVYIFKRNASWSQQAYIKASNTGDFDHFSQALDLDGDVLVVGARGEDSAAQQVNGNQADNTALSAGAAYVYRRSGNNWAYEAYLKPSNAEAGDEFGISVAVSGDRIAVGALHESSLAVGIDGDQLNNGAPSAGAVYLYRKEVAGWVPEAYVKGSNNEAGDYFGTAICLSGDLLAVAATGEDSASTGIDQEQANEDAGDSGAAYLFHRAGNVWTQRAYMKASNTGMSDDFGRTAIAIAGDGLVVGAREEDSNATGVNNGETNNAADGAGAAYVFH
jgi:trimeric autotransporter adhesin